MTKSFTILAGTYTTFVNSFNFTTGPSGSSISLIGQSAVSQSPSWLAQHPIDKSLFL